jgi:hypothetical protein
MCITFGSAREIVQPDRNEIMPALLRILAALPQSPADPASWRLGIEVWCIQCHKDGRMVRPVYTESEMTPAEAAIADAAEAWLDLGDGIPQAVERVRLECELAGYPQDPDFWAWLGE